jgi:hypothetical protein
MYAEEMFSVPTIFTLQNILPIVSPITLFLSSQNRGNGLNNGLPDNVLISFNYNTSTYTYKQLLAMSEDQPFKLWKFRYDVTAGDADAQTAEIMNVAMATSDGSISTMPLFPLQDLDQTQPNSREFRYGFDIDADRGLSFNVQPLTTMKFYLWYDVIASQSNLLMGGDTKVEMSKPFPLEAHDPYLVRIVWGEGQFKFTK